MSEATKPLLGERRLCSACVLEPHLHETILRDGLYESCFYCGEESNTFSINQIADLINDILNTLYDPLEMPNEEPEAVSGQPIAQVIGDLLVAEFAIAEDIRQVLADRRAIEYKEEALEDSLFHPARPYKGKRSVNSFEFDWDWSRFEAALKTEARYFNVAAQEILTSIFEGIHERKATNGRAVVIEAGPGTDFETLYRARVFQKEEEFREALKQPDVKLGPPPHSLAIAGRMNAAGISVFYGATQAAVAYSEVRPPAGGRVIVGCFEVTEPLKLLDLVALVNLADETGSPFDAAHLQGLKRAQFLRGLTLRLSRPVMPTDEPLDYLPTQAVADFLAMEGGHALDGIIYPSVQAGGFERLRKPRYPIFGRPSMYDCNVVLFHKVARVQPLEKGAEIFVPSDFPYLGGGLLEGGPDAEYTVWVPPPEVSETQFDDAPLKFKSLEAYYIRSVRIDAEAMKTSRYIKQQKSEE